MHSIDLTGKWQFRAVDSPEIPRHLRGITRWMKAAVPGTVHTDLMAAAKIADPFIGMNENDVQWIDKVAWIYRRSFTISKEAAQEPVIELVAEGLDTFATVSVNGKTVGTTANMFIAHRIPLAGVLTPGKSTIEIRFESPTLRALALEKEHGRLRVALQPHRVYARKAQYAFGWDWGPVLTTSGIWLPIRIEAHSGERLREPFVRVSALTHDDAECTIEVRVEGGTRGDLVLDTMVEGGESISLPVTEEKIAVRHRLARPRLWWPNGLGEQHLYQAKLVLRRGETILQILHVPFALRTVRLLQEPDDDGQSFIFEVNGEKIFCKGADWIPTDSFLPRAAEGRYQRLLTMARDASMNMIRVWGGGIYEKEIFYSLCDQLGLMVWQDFMYACGEYPDHPAFLEEARHEAEVTVKRLRNHPSIVLWCGNNECEWNFCKENPGKGADDMRGAKIFRDVLPEVVKELDTRPYWRSSPFGGDSPNAEQAGNHHQWDVWGMWRDYTEYRQDNARFVTEFGWQASPHEKTWEGVIDPQARSPQSAVMEHHNKLGEGTERLFRFLAAHYTVTGEWKDFLYKTQLLQADALKCAVEHWRRRKFHTAGALFWQLNDCWPVTSWSVIDVALRPKAAYYAARRFFAPLLVSFAPSGEVLEVWGTNDFLHEIGGRLTVTLMNFKGKTLARKSLSVRVPANESVKLFSVPESWQEKGGAYLRADIADRKRAIAVNRHLLVEPKHAVLPPARLRMRLHKTGPGVYRLQIRSNVFAPGVVVSSRREGVVFHDNFVDVDAGMPFDIAISSSLSATALKSSLTISAVNSRTSKGL